MNNKLNEVERRWVAWVKEQPCGVCGASGPSSAHHIVQHQQFTVIPLCQDCHQGSHNGIHGRMSIWKVMRLDEMKVLNELIRRFFSGRASVR